MGLTVCRLCDEPVGVEDDPRLVSGELAHRECLLRVVLGGIGHLEDHGFWCTQQHDPDGGRTPRQSALEVDAWVRVHGLSS